MVWGSMVKGKGLGTLKEGQVLGSLVGRFIKGS